MKPLVFVTQALLNLLLLLLPNSLDIFLCSIICRADLIEGVVFAFLKFLTDLLSLLVLSETLSASIAVHFLQSSFLVCSKSCLKSSLRMFVYLRCICASRQREGIKGIVNTSSIEGPFGLLCIFIQLGKIKTFGGFLETLRGDFYFFLFGSLKERQRSALLG